MGSEVVSTGSDNISRLNRDNSTNRVGNQTSIGQTGIGQTSVDTGIGVAMGSKVVSLGSKDSRLVSGDNSTVGVGNKGMGESIGIGVSCIGSVGIGESSIGIGMSISSTEGIGVSSTKGIRIGESLSAEVSSTCKSNCRLISRDNSTIGVGHQVAGGRDCDAGGENQELHVACLLC